jgi:hypothetical protein
VREVNAWKMAGRDAGLGDLIVGSTPEAGKPLRAGLEPHDERHACRAHGAVFHRGGHLRKASVTIDVMEDPDGPRWPAPPRSW